MKFILIRLAAAGLALAPGAARAGGDQVVVIYNTRVPESRAVADYYARMRQVPEKQIYGFALTPNEEMSRAEFRDSLQSPPWYRWSRLRTRRIDLASSWSPLIGFSTAVDTQLDLIC